MTATKKRQIKKKVQTAPTLSVNGEKVTLSDF